MAKGQCFRQWHRLQKAVIFDRYMLFVICIYSSAVTGKYNSDKSYFYGALALS